LAAFSGEQKRRFSRRRRRRIESAKVFEELFAKLHLVRLFPVPTVDVGAIWTVGNDPTRVAFAEFCHLLLLLFMRVRSSFYIQRARALRYCARQVLLFCKELEDETT